MLNQLQVLLDDKFRAVQTSIFTLESRMEAMSHKIESLTADADSMKTNLPAPYKPP